MRYCRSVGALTVAVVALLAFAADSSARPRHGSRHPVYRGPGVAFSGAFFWPGWGPYSPYGYPYYAAWWGGYPYPYAQPIGERVAVRLQVKPVDTDVYVDGHYAGKVDEFDGFFQRLHVSPGEHVIELYLDGHEAVREDLYASPGTTYKIRHEMLPLAAGEAPSERPRPREPEPTTAVTSEGAPQAPQDEAPSAPGFGVLVVRTRPDRAGVWIDGEPWPAATAPELVVHLPAGRHVIEVRDPGHGTFSTEVDIEAGQTTPLNVKLAPSE